jgi:hypothetical protein
VLAVGLSIVNMCLICDKNNVRSVLTFSCLYDGFISYLRYLCLCEHSGVQHILCDFCLSSSCVPNVASFPGLFILICTEASKIAYPAFTYCTFDITSDDETANITARTIWGKSSIHVDHWRIYTVHMKDRQC